MSGVEENVWRFYIEEVKEDFYVGVQRFVWRVEGSEVGGVGKGWEQSFVDSGKEFRFYCNIERLLR